MDLATLLRRVKRQFGDEYNIIINDQDIFDWANEAQMQIIRDTTANDVTVSRVANTFPVGISDRVKIKRVAVSNRALSYTTLSELDLTDIDSTSQGSPLYWYYTGGNLHLWPTPRSTDTYNVAVTYSKIPTTLSLVAPYLQWKYNPPTPQLATISADTDLNSAALDVTFKITLDSITNQILIACKGLDTTVAASLAWDLYFVGSNTIRLRYSNGTAIRTADLVYRPATPLVAGETITFRLTFDNTTGVSTLYRINSDGSSVVDDTDTQATSLPFNINTTVGYPIVFGGVNLTSVPGNWKLHLFTYSSPVGGPVFYTMDGTTDLATLPTVPATPFTVSTGQTMAVTGGLQIYSEDNTFSVPEVYHDDIVKFCIARAHNKNRNYKGEENMMEEFNQGVTMRRDEAHSVDAPTYKGADPFDYGWDWDSSYG